MTLGKNWSLFSEYYKIGEYKTAIPFGWRVIRLDSTRFKTVYQKLGDCYFNLYQRADSSERYPFADTVLIVYDMGIRNVPDRAAGLWLLKGYALESYFYGRELEAIAAYEQSRTLDANAMEMPYIDRLGVLYAKNAPNDLGLKKKAVDLYRWMLLSREMDERMVQLQRQGRIAFYIGAIGEDATVLGTVAGMDDQDWLFPSYREHAGALYRGMPLVTFVCDLLGNALGDRCAAARSHAANP